MKKNISFKDGVTPEDIFRMHPKALYMLAAYIDYAACNNLPAQITSLITDRKNTKSTSKTHEDGRAIDVSIKKWSKAHIHRFVYKINSEYNEIAAIGYVSQKPVGAVYGDTNHLDHIHLQVRP